MRKIVKNTSSGQLAQQLINPTKDQSYRLRGRVTRNGGWDFIPKDVRALYRRNVVPTRQIHSLGFRIVRNAS